MDIRNFFIFTIFLTSMGYAQQKQYDFINEKLETDSLFKAKLILEVLEFDTSSICNELQFMNDKDSMNSLLGPCFNFKDEIFKQMRINNS